MDACSEDEVNSIMSECEAMSRLLGDSCVEESGISCSMMQAASKQFESLNWTQFVHTIANDICQTMAEDHVVAGHRNEIIVSINTFEMHQIKKCLKAALYAFGADILSDIIVEYLFHNAKTILKLLGHGKTHRQWTENDVNKITDILSAMAILIIDKRSNDWFGIPRKKSDLTQKFSTVPFGCAVTMDSNKWCMFWRFMSVTTQFHTLCSKCREYFFTSNCFTAWYSMDEELAELE
eukprot:368917_1